MIGVPDEMFPSEARFAEPLSAGTLDIARTVLTLGAFYQIIHDDSTELVDNIS